jgi:hypothetical protein
LALAVWSQHILKAEATQCRQGSRPDFSFFLPPYC